MILALDTNILLYAFVPEKPTDAPATQRLRQDSRALLSQTSQLEFLIPAPVLGEFLSNYPPEQQRERLRLLQKLARVVHLDEASALYVGQIWYSHRKSMNSQERSRACVKLDVEIIACALRHEAQGMCSADQGLLSDWNKFAYPRPGGPPSLFAGPPPPV